MKNLRPLCTSCIWFIALLLLPGMLLQAYAQNVEYSDLYTDSTFNSRNLATNLAVGTTAGGAGVSSGSATYSIPVPVPPGTNGIAPSLSLEYNSRMPNGSLGMGWNIAGLSYITRVAQNSYFDNAAIPVSLSATDRFAIDGQRLLGKTGTYGAAESTYGTEVEDFSTIRAKGAQGGGPAWFEVITKDGLVMQYGYTADSRFMDQANNTVISWALNRVIYPDGNYIEYVYTSTDRDFRISEVRYTGNQNTSLAPYNKIEFAYKVRSDISTMYIAGSSVVSKFLLDKITVKSESDVTTGSYQLTYGNDNINSYLISLQQAGSDNIKMNPIIFKYGDQPVIDEFTNTNVPGGDNIISFSGDFNGDGNSDLLTATIDHSDIYGFDFITQFKTWKKDNDNGNFSLLATQNLPATSSYYLYNNPIPSTKNLAPVDINGDGLDDIIVLNIQYVANDGGYNRLDSLIYFETTSGGNSFITRRQVAPTSGGIGYGRINADGQFFLKGDFDGDGITEFIVMGADPFAGNDYKIFYYDNQPGALDAYTEIMQFGNASPGTRTDWYNAKRAEVIDFNGDGKSDILFIWDTGAEIYTFDTPTKFNSIYQSGSFPQLDKVQYYGDFNGDGKTDIISGNPDFSTVIQGLSTGTGFSQSSISLTSHLPINVDPIDSYYKNELIIGDFNGDGKSDIYYEWNRRKTTPVSEGNQLEYFVGKDLFYSTGSTLTYHELYYYYLIHTVHSRETPPTTSVGLTPIDINGDGKTDLVSSTGSYMGITYFHKNGKETLLHKVSNGLNQVSEWNYKSLSEGGNFYTKGSATSSYPVNVIQPVFLSVSEFKSQDGIGGNFTQQYSYENLRLHRAGKGLLGFGKITMTNTTMGSRTVDENEFNATYFTMLPKKSSTYLTSNNSLISETTLTNTLVSTDAKRFWIKTTSIAQNDALAGVTTTTSNTGFDSYGNITVSTTSIPGVHTSETITAYGAYPGSIPNKPTSVKVKKTRSGESAYETTTSFSYNTLGQLTSRTDFSGLPQSVTTAYGYTPLGNVNSTTISASGITTRSNSAVYDPKGRYPTESTNEMGHQSTAVYDARWGQPLSITRTDNLTTTFAYDGFGHLQTTNFPEGFSTNQTLHWDISGHQRFYQQTATAGKPTVKTWYDLLGRETKTETEAFNSGWVTQVKTYDAKGNVATETEPYQSSETYITTLYGYDTYNRQSSINQGALGTTTLTYNYSGGKLTVTTTTPSATTSQTTDAAGMLTSATDNGGTLNYAYYSHGGLKNVVNGSVTLTSSEYNAYGRQTKLIDVNAGTTDYEYNALGQLTWQMNALGQQTTMQYNLAGQVTQRIGVEGTTTYSYGTGNGGGEIKGQIKTVTGFEGTSTTYTYNSLAQLTQLKEVNNGDHITTYTYNSLGDLSTTTYPSGLVITNEYESKGYLKKIRHGSTDLYETTGVNGRGQVTAYTKGNNKNSIINYTHGLPVKYETTGIQNLNLVWDEQKGNLSSRNDAEKSKTETFTYDNLNRLTGTTVNGSAAFIASYAPNGNISTKTDAGTYSYRGDKINALYSVTNPAPAPIPLLQQDITYTAFMKADKVTENGYELSYTYGADYERTKSILKQAGNTLNTRYYFAGYEKDVTGGITRYIQYIAGPAGLVAIIESQGSSHTVHYTYTDHLGSILTVTNSSGSIEAEQSFDAWGRRRNPSTWALLSPVAATGLPVWLYRGYTGHEHLDQFGLINMNGRMYDPVLGRMLSPDNFIPDPLFSQDYNRYTYARNNPLIFIDPDGNIPVVIFVGAALIGGGSNLWNNWSKIKNFKQGLAYFASGAAGGAVSVVNPALGGSITAYGNVVTDVVTGNLPNFQNGLDVITYAGGLALDGLGAAGAGSLSKLGYRALSSAFSSGTTVAISGAAGSTTIERFLGAGIDDIAFSSLANYEVIVKPAIRGVGNTVIANAAKTGTTVFQKHHIIPNQTYKAFKTDLKAIGWKQNDMLNLKKLPTPFHGNHPAYNNYIMNEMNLLKQSGNLNLNSMQNLQHNMRLMIGDAYRSGGTLNQYFKF